MTGREIKRKLRNTEAKWKQMEERLKVSEYFLERSQTIAKMGSWKWTFENDQVEWSDGMFNIFGVDPEKFSGDLESIVTKVIHPDDLERVQRANEVVTATQRPVSLEYRIVREDGEERMIWADGEVVNNADGEVVGLLGYAQDITECKRTEDALQKVRDELELRVAERTAELRRANRRLQKEITEREQTEETLTKLSSVVEQTADIVMVTDRNGIIEYVNPSFELFTGYAANELIGETPRILKSGKHDRAFYQKLWDRILSGEIYRDTLVNKKKNGELYYSEKIITPIKNSRGTITHFVSTDRDITDQIQLAEQLHQSQKMQAVGQLTAGVAHNLNNRLMAVSTIIELLILNEKFDLTGLNRARASVDDASKIVEQLLLFSRLGNSVDKHPVSMQEVVRDAMAIGQITFDRKIALVDQVSEMASIVSGDANQLVQVFLNLLLNARDALEESEEPAPCIQIESHVVCFLEKDLQAHSPLRAGDYTCICIADNGVGMDEQTRQRIFEPFFTTKEIGEGTGLGLATVYAILEAHQGWIDCQSQEGIGTTFLVYLPVVEQEADISETAQPQELPRGTETLLCIEDEEDILNQHISIFKRYGYEVLAGKDGQEGWDIFEREWEHIDAVLLDLSLPNISGQEVMARMLETNPDTKIVLSTGYAQYSAESLGARALLHKPYQLTQAVRTMRQVLDE